MSVAGSSVVVHVRHLRWCGFMRAPRSRAHDAYRALTLALTGAYLVQECVYACRERGDMEELARVMFLLLCHVTSIVKQLVFFVDADRIDALIASLDAPLYNPSGERAGALLASHARTAARFVRAYSGTAVVTCTLWAVFPVLHHVRGQPVQLPFWVNFEYERSLRFICSRFSLVLFYSYYVTTLVGIANTTMDALIATILNQCKTQLTILRMNFEDLPERARALAAADGTGGAPDGSARYERALHRLFLECLAHYSQICQ